MYKPSPQALKSMMVVKPQGDNYESQATGASNNSQVSSSQQKNNSPTTKPVSDDATINTTSTGTSQRTPQRARGDQTRGTES